MPEKATRRSVKKSRGGCSRCKSQHLKCDEKRPACSRCERLNIPCPGYTQPIKWSRKHELSRSVSSASSPSPSVHTIGNMEDPFTPLPVVQDFDWLDFTIPSTNPDSSVISTPGAAVVEAVSEPFQTFDQTTWPPGDTLFRQEEEAQELQVAPAPSQLQRKQYLLQSLGARMNPTPQLHRSLMHEPYELISYYFKTIPALYSTFDSHKNPFRSSVSKLFSHSLAVNLAAQSMAAACLVEVHPRFISIGSRLRREALEAVEKEPNHDYDVLLALIMSGPTGNWFQADDLGVASYHAMRDRLDALAVAGATDKRISFFQEAMVMWELFLAYANPSILRPSLTLPPMIQSGNSDKIEPHAWNGIARDTLQLVRDIGRLVRGNRLRSLNNKFVSQAHIHQLNLDLAKAQDLERRLLETVHPSEEEIAPTEDAKTPLWHITTMAELFRYAGLLQLYRVFPDLLSHRLQREHGFAEDSLAEFGLPFEVSDHVRNRWLTAFALEGVRLLESIDLGSGTKDFQPFLLVTLANELVCPEEYPAGGGGGASSDGDLIFTGEMPDRGTIGGSFVEVAIVRKFVLDRLTSFLHLIPPKPIRVCLDIVRETWRRMDEGQTNVYWLDVMIEHGWETIMA